MAALRMEAPFMCRSSAAMQLNWGPQRHLASAVAVPVSTRWQVLSTFPGQQPSRRTRHCSPPSRPRRMAVAEALPSPEHRALLGLGSEHGPNSVLGAEHMLDDFARFLYYKIKGLVAPYLPREYDPLAFLPLDLHERVHKGEIGAIIFVREVLHFTLFYFLFCKAEDFCKWLNWLYKTYARKDLADHNYEGSNFQALGDPLRFIVVVWAATRFCHIAAHLMRLRVEPFITAKIRASALVIAVTWFGFKLKALYVQQLISANKSDAPRIFAFDKVVSLVVYLVAASSIGEVTGFGLRSLLAVGGFSGVALGLASREIVSNFFGGAVLFATRPFVIGERIKAGQFTGYVQDIGFLQTKILNMERVPMVIPNQSFTNQAITNFSRATNKLLEAEFQLKVDDIFRVDVITSRIVKYLSSNPDVDEKESSPVCYLHSIGMSDIHMQVRCVIRPTGGIEFYRAQQSILVHIAEIIASEGAWTGHSPPPALPPSPEDEVGETDGFRELAEVTELAESTPGAPGSN